MKQTPNFKISWLIQHKLLALTHFHSDITQNDIQGVITQANQLLVSVNKTFHLLIDNRQAPMSKLFTLEDLQKVNPMFKQPLLHWVVVVKPNHLTLGLEDTSIQSSDDVELKNVVTVLDGIDFLESRQAIDRSMIEDRFFFPRVEIT
ncbi:hypothetical protein BKI52_03140 [marine bacterium AO1-C]|nr:hypothetical protein BKI52_03140 [marine bacterium AO1-C]